jgi:hypothetical protein
MGSATKKRETPALQLVSEPDPELFNKDLDWYYNCFDSECGLRSAEGGIADALADGAARATSSAATAPSCDKCGRPTTRASLGLKCNACGHTQAAQVMPVKHGGGGGASSDIYDDRCAGFPGEPEGTFTRGRRVRNRVVGLPWSIQEDLRRSYDRRERATLTEARVRRAHIAYAQGFLVEEKKAEENV